MGGLIPYVKLCRSKNFEGTDYEVNITFLRLGFVFSVLMPWGGYGPPNHWRPW